MYTNTFVTYNIIIAILMIIISILWTLCVIFLNSEIMMSMLMNRGLCESVIETTNMMYTRTYFRCMYDTTFNYLE